MKKLFILSAIMMLGIMLSAQTQQGYVKTKGRLANDGSVIAGTRIPNATISVKGRTPVISQANGTFSFPIPADKFYLQNVQKQGYVLTDPEVLSKQYTYSANDLIIVMEDLAQQEADRRAIERKISSKLYTQLQQRGEELEALKKQNKITEEKYRELLQQLNQDQDDNEKIIKDMAERYTKMDFDQINEFNRKVSEYILNGELLKADSMINSKGNLLERIDQLNLQHEANAQVRSDLEKNESLEQRNREDIANDCYSKFEICKMQHLNDSAAYWIELRAGLDTMMVQWQHDAGEYLCEFVSNYSDAFKYDRRALGILLSDNDSVSIAKAYHCISMDLYNMEQYENSLSYELMTLRIYEKHAQNNFLLFASSYDALSLILDALGRVNEAVAFEKESIENLKKDTSTSNSYRLAKSYNNLGSAYISLDEPDSAYYYLSKSLNLYLIIKESTNDIRLDKSIARTYQNIGIVYSIKEQFDKAINYYHEALSIYTDLFGDESIYAANIYNNLGICYTDLMKYDSSLLYFNKSLAIKQSKLEENSPNIARTFTNLAKVYFQNGDIEKAIEYQKKSINVYINHFGETHSSVANGYSNIAMCYKAINNSNKAIEYYMKAATIYQEVFGLESKKAGNTYFFIGNIYYKENNYLKALETYTLALSILEKTTDFDNEDYNTIKEKISIVQAKLKEQESQPNE